MIRNYETPTAFLFKLEENDVVTTSSLDTNENDNLKSIGEWKTGTWKDA